MRKITIEVKINTFGNMLYSLNHPTQKGLPSLGQHHMLPYDHLMEITDVSHYILLHMNE